MFFVLVCLVCLFVCLFLSFLVFLPLSIKPFNLGGHLTNCSINFWRWKPVLGFCSSSRVGTPLTQLELRQQIRLHRCNKSRRTCNTISSERNNKDILHNTCLTHVLRHQKFYNIEFNYSYQRQNYVWRKPRPSYVVRQMQISFRFDLPKWSFYNIQLQISSSLKEKKLFGSIFSTF